MIPNSLRCLFTADAAIMPNITATTTAMNITAQNENVFVTAAMDSIWDFARSFMEDMSFITKRLLFPLMIVSPILMA